MITQEQINGGWNEIKGKAKKHWGDLSDDDLKQFEGSVDEFIGMVQQKTGEARGEIEKWLDKMGGEGFLDHATESAREYAEAAANAATEQYHRVRDQVAAGHAEAEEMVQRRPVESVAVAFGAGIIAGVVVGLLSRSRS